MPGLASLLNGKPADGNFIIHVFYTTNLLGVGFQRMSGKRSGKDPTDRFEASEDGQQGIVADDGQLAAIEYNGVHLVLGSTVKKESKVYNDISIVSPVYKDIEKTEVKHKGLAVCKTDEDLSIFYISGTDEKALKVLHHTYESDNTVSLVNMNQLLPGSSLAAYYNKGSDIRYVIYQAAEDQHLYEYDVEDRTFKEIKNSVGARPGTRIAVTYNDTQKKAYLYYTTQSDELRRIIKDNDKWGPSSEVGVSKVDPASQVTVTFSDDTNHIFYVEKGKSASDTNDADSFAGGYIKHVRDRTDN